MRILIPLAAGVLFGFYLPLGNTGSFLLVPVVTAIVGLQYMVKLRFSSSVPVLFVLFLASFLYTCTSVPNGMPSGVLCEDRVTIVGKCVGIVPSRELATSRRVKVFIKALLDDNGVLLDDFSGVEGLLELYGPYWPGKGQCFAVTATFLGWNRYHNEALHPETFRGHRAKTYRFKAHVRDMILLKSDPVVDRWFSPFRCLSDRLEQRTAAFLQAVLLGERNALSYSEKDLLRRAGAYHVLAISGVHIGLLVLILLTVFGAAGLSRKMSIKISILLIFGYIIMIGGGPSSVRAFIMISVFLGSNLLQRYRSSFNSLGVAAVVILCIWPVEITRPGFLLSFSAVTGILLSGNRGEGVLDKQSSIATKIKRYASSGVRISLSAFLAQMPVMASFFGALYPVSIVSNLVILPLLGLILPLGLAFLFFAVLGDWITSVLAPVVEGVVFLLFEAAAFFGQVKPIVDVCDDVFFLTLLTSGGLLCLSTRSRRFTAFCLVCSAVLFVWVKEIRLPVPGSQQMMRAAFVDVGDGDCTIIELTSGHTIMIDTGTTGFGSVPSQVTGYLKDRKKDFIDLLVLTHPHDDHFGDALEVLQRFSVGSVVGINPQWKQEGYADVLALLEERGIPYFTPGHGDTALIGSAGLVFLDPVDRAMCSLTENDRSVVFRFEYRDFSIMFAGDAEVCKEGGLVRTYGPYLRSDVLKVGHHGSKTSSSSEFLLAVDPALAVISCGRAGKFNHPFPEILHRFEKQKVRVLRTDTHGGILLEYGGKLSITTSLAAGDP